MSVESVAALTAPRAAAMAACETSAMLRPYEEVDVFGIEPCSGNPVAVVLDAGGLSADEMQRFARWTNLSETTFVLPASSPRADYRVRIFTPAGELPFAGHPTLGTCHAWLRRHASGAPRPPASGEAPLQEPVRGERETAVQECAAGMVAVRRTDVGLGFLAPAVVRGGPVDPRLVDRLTALVGVDASEVLDAQWVDNGPGWVALLLCDADAVLRARPGAVELPIGVVGRHPSGSAEAFEVRAFFPLRGATLEDPVTGSLNASVAQWLVSTGRAVPPYAVRQGTLLGRTGRVHVLSDGEGGILIAGRTATLVSGEVEL